MWITNIHYSSWLIFFFVEYDDTTKIFLLLWFLLLAVMSCDESPVHVIVAAAAACLHHGKQRQGYPTSRSVMAAAVRKIQRSKTTRKSSFMSKMNATKTLYDVMILNTRYPESFCQGKD
jgi:hypothetical protein